MEQTKIGPEGVSVVSSDNGSFSVEEAQKILAEHMKAEQEEYIKAIQEVNKRFGYELQVQSNIVPVKVRQNE